MLDAAAGLLRIRFLENKRRFKRSRVSAGG